MKKHPAWLDAAVFYYIFQPSFYDANGDGIGDLLGITRKLDYIKSLGCNALWITPCFVSPFNDGGYDVADYYRIAPRYGTNADMRRLLAAARRRGIHVCLDLVAGHTSAQHPWFKRSCEPKNNKYWHRYIWTEHFRDKGEGCGLQFIRGYAPRDGNYAVNFFYTQPALNYGFYKPDPAQKWQVSMSHPAARANVAELKKIMRFWLDMGVSGFRVDMAHSLVKGDPERKGTAAIWREVRRMFDREYPDAALIAEWGIAGVQPDADVRLLNSIRDYWPQSRPLDLDSIDYGNWRDDHRDWFAGEFPWIFSNTSPVCNRLYWQRG